MNERMEVIGSLRKIAGELSTEPDNVYQAMEMMHGAAYMIRWIADNLELLLLHGTHYLPHFIGLEDT